MFNFQIFIVLLVSITLFIILNTIGGDVDTNRGQVTFNQYFFHVTNSQGATILLTFFFVSPAPVKTSLAKSTHSDWLLPGTNLHKDTYSPTLIHLPQWFRPQQREIHPPFIFNEVGATRTYWYLSITITTKDHQVICSFFYSRCQTDRQSPAKHSLLGRGNTTIFDNHHQAQPKLFPKMCYKTFVIRSHTFHMLWIFCSHQPNLALLHWGIRSSFLSLNVVAQLKL